MSNTTPEGAPGAGDDARARREDALVSDDSTPLVLCVDTATDARSVAVARGRRVVSLAREAAAQGRSSALLEEIDSALRAAGVALREIDLYAVATGPGSFTGLRAGLATIKAFASIHPRPVAAVPTLHAVALSAGASPRTLAMIPAGRGEVFAQTLRVEEGGRVIGLTGAAHAAPSAVLRRAAGRPGGLVFAGSGARAHAELIGAVAREAGIELIGEGEAGVTPDDEGSDRDGGGARSAAGDRAWRIARGVEDYAAEIARLGLISYGEGAVVGAHDLVASYVRPSDAELNERWHR
jgi:tRNA threonylcarbamoyladenosine biosynthesis protein TsaB